MRKVVIRAVPGEPEDGPRQQRLVELLSSGLQRLIASNGGESNTPLSLDYLANLAPTSDTDATVSEDDD
ncbi:MAG: hypothetical protein ACE5Q6_17310 [Dehalococcoidia bacterium]